MKMKKLISLLLAGIMFMMIGAQAAYAVPLKTEDGKMNTDALKLEFKDLDAEDLGDVCDAVYYSPVDGSTDTTKYPVFVWIHGMHSGGEKRAQIDKYEITNWASDEFQARFANAGGCFIFAPRARDSWENDWNPKYSTNLMRAIEYFTKTFAKNVDTSRIYIGGYSTGGAMVWDMLVSYPQYFAGALVAAPISQVTDVFNDATVSKICDIPIWVISSDNDSHLEAQTEDIRPIFEKMASLSSNKANLRWTMVQDAVFADESRVKADDAQHYNWEIITYDMHMIDGVTPYKYCTTIDGNGNTISFDDSENGIISWLSQQVKPETERDTSNKGESTFDRIINSIKSFFQKIVNFFKSIF